LLNNAKTLGGKVAQYAEAGKKQSFSEVSQALAKHRLIRQINVDLCSAARPWPERSATSGCGSVQKTTAS
jgi:hypothetical protein